MKTLRKVFLGGLAAVLPLAVTVYILYWIGTTAESLFAHLFKALWSERHYSPGLGLVLGVLLIFAVGVLVHLWFIRRLLRWGEGLLERIPLVKTLYGSVRDMLSYFGGSKNKEAVQQVVMVSVGGSDARLLGMVTRTSFGDLPEGVGTDDDVAVFLPMSYQMGGFTVIVPRAQVKPIDMSFQEAMRLALTACMATEKEAPRGELPPTAGPAPQAT